MKSTRPEYIVERVRELLSGDAAVRLQADAVVDRCPGCQRPLVHRGTVEDLGVLECVSCRRPFVRRGVLQDGSFLMAPVAEEATQPRSHEATEAQTAAAGRGRRRASA